MSARRLLCSAAARSRSLFVSYADPATLRSQLIGIAQQVRAQCSDAPPQIIMPTNLRHGYWFLRFRSSEPCERAVATLHGKPFSSACGTLQGHLQLDEGTRPLDLRAMLNLPHKEPEPVERWLRGRFGMHGTIESLEVPRLRNRWDQGLAFVRFADAAAADAALAALDGTPSPISGCNMYIDYATPKPLRVIAQNPLDAGYARGPKALPPPTVGALES